MTKKLSYTQQIAPLASLLSITLLVFFLLAALMGWVNQVMPVGAWSRHYAFPLVVTLTLSISYMLALGTVTRKILFSFIALMVLAALLTLSFLFMDLSWDGQDYHQRAVLRLLEGANFLYYFAPTENIWVNHYTKATWYYATTLVGWFDRSEVGASYSFVLAVAAGAYAFRFTRWAGQGKNLSALIGVMVVFNPVTVTQSYTYYNDAALGSLSVILFLSAIMMVRDDSKYDLSVFIITSILAINVKASGFIVVGAAFLYVSFAYWHALKSFTRAFRRTIGPFSAFAVIGIGVLGYSPYIQNLSHDKHFFYPLAGAEAVDIMTNNAPYGFTENSRFYNLFVSIFSHSSNISAVNGHETPTLKIPGTVEISELDSFLWADTRIGGLGPLYSLMFIIGVAMLFSFRLNWAIAGPLFIMVILSVFINPHAWWARYAPILWLLPAIPLISFKEMRFRYAWLIPILFFAVATENVGLILNRWLNYFPQVNRMIEERITPIVGKEINLYSGSFIVALQLKRFNVHHKTVSGDYYNANKDKFTELWGGVYYEKE